MMKYKGGITKSLEDEMKKVEDDRKETEDKMKKVEGEMKKVLTHFVETHVFYMLESLYKKLDNLDKGSQRPDTQSHRAAAWYKQLSMDINASRTENNDCLVLGPVGERPLHVCSLSAYRFPNIDFHSQGNYVQEGIIEGMKKFIESEKGPGWNEARVPYGKGYVALVGAYIDKQWKKSKESSSNPRMVLQFISKTKRSPWDWMEQVDSDGGAEDDGKLKPWKPPFWDLLVRWYGKTHFAPEYRLFPWPWDKEASPEMKSSSKIGLYEGETIVYPMIAASDVKSLVWVFETERKAIAENEKAGAKKL